MRRGPFILIDILLVIAIGICYWNGTGLGKLEERIYRAITTAQPATQIPPVITVTAPGEIGFMVQAGRLDGTQVFWTTISPGGVERKLFTTPIGGELSQTFTVPRCDTLCITLVRRNPLTP